MTLSYAEGLRHSRLNAVGDALDAAENPGYIVIFAGDVPANVGASIGEAVALSNHELSSPPFTSVTAGVATFDAIGSDEAAATNTAAFFRAFDGDDNPIVQGTVGTATSDLIFNTVSFVATGTVAITSLTLGSGNTGS